MWLGLDPHNWAIAKIMVFGMGAFRLQEGQEKRKIDPTRVIEHLIGVGVNALIVPAIVAIIGAVIVIPRLEQGLSDAKVEQKKIAASFRRELRDHEKDNRQSMIEITARMDDTADDLQEELSEAVSEIKHEVRMIRNDFYRPMNGEK